MLANLAQSPEFYSYTFHVHLHIGNMSRVSHYPGNVIQERPRKLFSQTKNSLQFTSAGTQYSKTEDSNLE